MRAKIQSTILRANGDPATTGTAFLYLRGTSTQVPMFAAETGGSALTQPVNIVDGKINAWAELGSYDINAAGAGFTTFTAPTEVAKGTGRNITSVLQSADFTQAGAQASFTQLGTISGSITIITGSSVLVRITGRAS